MAHPPIPSAQQTEPLMINPDTTLDEELEELEADVEALERPGRAIPLPKDDDEDDGVGPTTGIVP